MTKLKWWMRIVGAFYILLGIQNTPPLVTGRLETQYPTLVAPVESVVVQGLIDMWFMFGVEMLVVGVMLIVAAKMPLRNKILVQTVLWLEIIRGVAIDVYWLTRGFYTNGFYIGFIVVHLIIIISGFIFLRQAEKENEHVLPGEAVRNPI